MGMCEELLMTFGVPSVCVWLRSGRPFRSVSKSSMYLSASIGVAPRGNCFLDSSVIMTLEFNHINESVAGVPPHRRNQWGARRNHFSRTTKKAGNNRMQRLVLIKQWSSIMWGFIGSLYRAFCYARLLEMRRNRHHASHA
jgi:hypothetical protein